MSEQLVIRAVEKRDYAEWDVLWQGYNAFYGRSGETALAPEISQMTWTRFFDPYEPMHAMVAERGGKLLGLVHFLYHRSTIQIAPSCYLQDLFTAEDARGLGVGRALIEAAYEHAKAAGIPRVYWQTRESNVAAMQLYDKVAEKTGFVIYHKKL
ncbi:GNAT family N-acetyltransferase [Massilia sp. YIM B04103]|uniref:GNAT family N-acetyltransferase n=1 Tax=Massilia sp. YIM B04103 TaxID=2963106 RepID=UPI00210A3685|nr:GNAT family N-acetyltransferase [Massilia sp. YIM B04103]